MVTGLGGWGLVVVVWWLGFGASKRLTPNGYNMQHKHAPKHDNDKHTNCSTTFVGANNGLTMRFDEALPNVINTTNARPYPRPTHTVSHRGRNSASGHNACHKFPKDLCAATVG